MVHIFTEGGLTDGEITGMVIGIAVVSVVLVGVIVILVIRSVTSITYHHPPRLSLDHVSALKRVL